MSGREDDGDIFEADSLFGTSPGDNGEDDHESAVEKSSSSSTMSEW
jgi:hypothetical protein